MTPILEDITQFNSFFAENRQRFIQFAVTYIHDQAAAEDIFMESMMALWEKRHELTMDVNLPAYVLTSIKNKSLNYLRHVYTVKENSMSLDDSLEWELTTQIATLEACDPQTLFSREIQDIIDKVLADQSETTARIFMLSRYENKSYKEIAEIMGMTVKGVEFHISKVTKVLRIALKDYLVLFPFLCRALIIH